MKFRLALFVVILALTATIGINRLKADTQQTVPTPCVVLVPSDWGDFKGISRYGLAFEDKDGTLRLIDQMPCSLDRGQVGVPKVSVEIRRR